MARTTKGESPKHPRTELPKTLAALVAQANSQAIPEIADIDAQTVPELWTLLCPRWVDQGSLDGNGQPRMAWAESLMSVVWDAGLGAWRWTLTNRALNTRVTGTVAQLAQLAEGIESKIVAREVVVKQIKPR